MKNSFWQKEGVRSVLASLLSIVIGLLAGSVIIVIVGCATPSLGFKSAWEGVRLVMLGLFSKGRDAVGNLVFGFNPSSVGNMLFRATPLIMTGLSVAVAFKTVCWPARCGARFRACSRRCSTSTRCWPAS